ncbi:nicotinate (nicotinamide) nucleotide adenylyltransferase [Hymenobacter sp. GOD-10R]|uniref:nicotinate (nicotinamide) nucleotide adenylyltransferase n=1 Tax=Hymenobacter sp. GOD-10R TaxID=3093922 RepID=UPI002D77438C|nr:nicotinate (nicotinamide) nucleotide adenylyltransferase [Hymenobacter sp. GOD-10R]WRQ29392.1 nicotinate (nicotinamide) nucleotide adenylyltransferase [Hymenobacter sp. GOD-10R]
MNTAPRIGLLFGSFNPIHTGHLIVANFMATHTDLDAVWLVVSPQSPFKAEQELLAERERYHLVQLAIAGNERLRALDTEFGLPKPSYTVDTLSVLRTQYPNHQFVLLMGEDNLAGLPKWKQVDHILEETPIYVYPRSGASALPKVPEQARVVEAPLLDISATFIRNCIRNGKSIRYLVPENVEEEITRKGYWQ